MLRLGAHMSVAGGLEKAFEHAVKVDSDGVQIFTKNQRQWKAKPLEDEQIAVFKRAQEESGIHPVVAHNSYLVNLATPKDDLWEKSIAGQREELERCEALGIPFLVSHPGAHTGSGRDAGILRIIAALNRLHEELPGFKVKTLLETTAGQGTTIGATFEDLSELLNGVAAPERLGVCFDTCHTFVASYDNRTPEAYAETMDAFDELIGLDQIGAFHFNDALGELGCKRDRHAHIGKGTIGVEGFRNYMNDTRIAGKAALLETDKGDDLAEDREAIELLRSLVAKD